VQGVYYSRRRTGKGDAEDKRIAFLQSMVKLEMPIDFLCTDGLERKGVCRPDSGVDGYPLLVRNGEDDEKEKLKGRIVKKKG
jgi:hypothetical protein